MLDKWMLAESVSAITNWAKATNELPRTLYKQVNESVSAEQIEWEQLRSYPIPSTNKSNGLRAKETLDAKIN